MIGLFLPQKSFKTKRCERCDMSHDAKLDCCPHCAGIADGQALDEFKDDHAEQLQGNSNLGLMFLGAALLAFVLVLLALL